MAAGDETDEALYAEVGQGDRAAFGILVERHRRRVMALALRVAGDHGQAEEITQEAFTRAWVKAPSWRNADAGGTARFGTWLTRIVLNLAIDTRRRVVPFGLDQAAEIAADTVPADAAIGMNERQQAVARAVASLPERQRAAIALTYDEDLTNAEAARVLETSVGALELLLVRARRSLRQALAPLLEEEA